MLQHAPPKFFGTRLVNGQVCFRLWAPNQERVSLLLELYSPIPMQNAGNGWHELLSPVAKAGIRYKFLLEGGLEVPDPASRFQPEDVHGPSEVVDPGSYSRSEGGWIGRSWEEGVIYELHIGTFTPEGTFGAPPSGWTTWRTWNHSDRNNARRRLSRKSQLGL